MLSVLPAQTGYLFGTFNPITIAHYKIAQAAAEKGRLKNVVFVPAFAPPNKQGRTDVASFEHRSNMVEIAARYQKGFSVSRIEAGLPVPSYSVATLRSLIPTFDPPSPRSKTFQALSVGEKIKTFGRYLYNRATLAVPGVADLRRIPFIIGSDEFNSLAKWKEPEVLLKRLFFLVGVRKDDTLAQSFEVNGKTIIPKFQTFTVPGWDKMRHVSATMVRDNLAEGKPIADLVAPGVEPYIRANGLYGAQPAVKFGRTA